jgi:hypothetical protein
MCDQVLLGNRESEMRAKALFFRRPCENKTLVPGICLKFRSSHSIPLRKAWPDFACLRDAVDSKTGKGANWGDVTRKSTTSPLPSSGVNCGANGLCTEQLSSVLHPGNSRSRGTVHIFAANKALITRRASERLPLLHRRSPLAENQHERASSASYTKRPRRCPPGGGSEPAFEFPISNGHQGRSIPL